MNNSKFFSLHFGDLFKGAVVAFLSAALAALIQVLEAGALPDLAQLKSSALAGAVAGLAYLCKNLLTNSEGQIAKKEPK